MTSYGLELLAFAPHPDDAELFCGGLLALAHSQGHRTGIIDLTRGERASRGTPELRAQESAEAAKLLGLTLRENLGLPDGGLTPGDPRAVDALIATIRRLRPEVVLVPWERERHPDHEATSALVSRALFFAGVGKEPTTFRPRQILFYPQRQLADPPSLVVDVTAVHPLKQRAIAAYASQVQPNRDAPATVVGSPLSLSSLEARDRLYGAMIGVAHGEPYLLREAVGLRDPIEHFRSNAFSSALFFPTR